MQHLSHCHFWWQVRWKWENYCRCSTSDACNHNCTERCGTVKSKVMHYWRSMSEQAIMGLYNRATKNEKKWETRKVRESSTTTRLRRKGACHLHVHNEKWTIHRINCFCRLALYSSRVSSFTATDAVARCIAPFAAFPDAPFGACCTGSH